MQSMRVTVKQLAMEAFSASMPTSILFGEVTSISPLQISLEQHKVLTEEFLILTNNVKNHITTLKLYESDARDYTVYNALKVGEKVILLQQQGGQEYIVLDRM